MSTGGVSYPDRLTHLARTQASSVAVVVVDGAGAETSMTYGGLEEASLRTARALVQHGVGADTMVVLALPNGLDHVVVTQAAWKLGACVLAVSPSLSAHEYQRLVTLAAQEFRVFGIGGPVGTTVDVGDLVARAGGFPGDPLPPVTPCPGKAVASGGSTGAPKIIVDPRPLADSPGEGILAIFEQTGWSADGTTLVASPLYHAGPLRFLTATLFGGGTVILMQKYDADLALELVERHRVRWWGTTPLHLLRMSRCARFAEADLSTLRGVMHSSAPCPAWLKQLWIDRTGPDRVFELYIGSEENGCAVASGAEWLARPGTVGRGFRTDVRIVDPGTGGECAPGELGDVYLRSHAVSTASACRYVGAPPLARTSEGFSSLGDVGHVDAEGYLFLVDRRADLIISGGVNVYPAEVEGVLLEHPAVLDTVVVGLSDVEWGERVHAVVLPVAGVPVPDSSDLLRFCRSRLSGAKVPRSLTITDTPFRDESGKVRRRAVAAGLTGRPSP
jgi:bile acid-coenzyme A ligase